MPVSKNRKKHKKRAAHRAQERRAKRNKFRAKQEELMAHLKKQAEEFVEERKNKGTDEEE